MNTHDINYKLYGDDMQFVEIELDPQETVIAEAGSLMMMEDQIRMETIFGDGSSQGLVGKLFSAGKRILTGESLFMTSLPIPVARKNMFPLHPPILAKSFPWI